ncbi:hypothetical protein UB43_15560 [Pseudomonas sp. 21]|uniref:hypothetical protein n=1 Tax=unclassified Pseudomonas TaxID=196821 RepID=UPI0005EBB93E|nr:MULTISPECIES: hypothetical protein [unclassified Pseudomonas]KJJ98106.1 hypothetical protein UB43_15560 [Pseudomonas sp. 21]MBV7583839.1 hypothetical protein [Pseudomonas sp. PDM33]
MTVSETAGVTVILGPEVAQVLGQSFGLAVKDTLGQAIADGFLRLQGKRTRAVADGSPEPSGSALHQALRQESEGGEEIARQTLEALREIATLLRRPTVSGALGNAVQIGATAPTSSLQPVNVDWTQKDPVIYQVLSNPLDAISMALTSSHRYEQRVQELVVRGGLEPGETSEAFVKSRVEAAAQGSGLNSDAALDMVRQLMNVGLTLRQSLNYLPAATKLQYGKAVAPDAVAALVRNVLDHGDDSAAGVERSLGVISWRARQEQVPTDLLVRRLNDGQEHRSWAQMLQRPSEMRIKPAAQLQADVDARRGTTQGWRHTAENAVEGMLQTSGSVTLKVVDEGLPALTFAADRLKESTHFVGAQFGLMTGQYGLSKEMLATFASELGLDDVSQYLKSLDLGVMSDRSQLITKLGAPLARRRDESDSDWRLPSLDLRGLWRRMRSDWGNVGFGPAARPPGAQLNEPVRPPRGSRVGAGGDAPGNDDSTRALGGALAGSMLGAWTVPVLGPFIGAVVGGLTDWGGVPAERNAPAIEGRGPEPRDGRSGAESPAAAPIGEPTTQNWTFSPQISINVAGNVSDPDRLANELLPRLRWMLADFSQERQRDALFDTVVV